MPPLETIEFECPHCHKTLATRASAIATRIACAHCGKKLKVPSRTFTKASGSANVVVTGFGLVLIIIVGLIILVPTSMYFYSLVTGDASSEVVEQQRKALASEAQVIATQLEQANRDHDMSRLKEIRDHDADYQKRATEFRRTHGH